MAVPVEAQLPALEPERQALRPEPVAELAEEPVPESDPRQVPAVKDSPEG